VTLLSNPTLGVLALYWSGEKLEERPYFQRLFRHARKLGIDMLVMTPEDLHPTRNKVNAWLYSPEQGWYRKWSDIPDIIYDRCRFQRTYRFQLLRKFRAEYKDLLFLNRPMAHKWGVHQHLQKNAGIRPHLPATVSYRQPSDLQLFLRKYDLVYLKPSDGTGGRGVIRIESLNNGLYLIGARDKTRRIMPQQRVKAAEIPDRLARFDLKNKYLIQQGIQTELKDGRVHDFRLLMQKNGHGQWEATGCAGRIGAKRSITSNLHGGGTAVPMLKLLRSRFSNESKVYGIVRSMEQLGHQVAEELERTYGRLCELALDIGVDGSGKTWLIEANPKPSREVFREIGEMDTYNTAIRRPLEYALWLRREYSR
jgi:glutathione synthase/RimK-type ligase-like ATP-grasp enzyme